MKDRAQTSESLCGETALRRLLVALTVVSAMGIGLWAWLINNRGLLPSPDSKAGRELLRQYQGTTFDIWLAVLGLAAGYLIHKIYTSKQKESKTGDFEQQRPVQSCLHFIRKNPLTVILLAAYAVVMIKGTTYLYGDMIGWYPDLVKGYFLDNFSLRSNFISETMRRTDYRFFPLAHQDLHILSWFSIHIKTWMLLGIAELIAIILLSVQFLNNIEERKWARASTVFLVASTFLIHPSTATVFSQVFYPERLLCLIFTLYINSYLTYTRKHNLSSFYATLLWALIGIYIKDIAIILFTIPPAALWAEKSIRLRSRSENKINLSLLSHRYRLEHWLCSLLPIFISNYIFLALIPSSYALNEPYGSYSHRYAELDFRFALLALIFIIRLLLISKKKLQFCLIDAINLSAFAYSLALFASTKLDTNTHLALPIQLIATLNIGWAWIAIIEKRNNNQIKETKKIICAFLVSMSIMTIDHASSQHTFAHTLKEIKFEQSYVQESYEMLDKISRQIRESGEKVNIITPSKSKFSAKRHLNRIPYHSLIEYFPGNRNYFVKDGAGKGENYSPKKGDIVANLDKTVELIRPILDAYKTELIYRHNPSERTGMVLRITSTSE